MVFGNLGKNLQRIKTLQCKMSCQLNSVSEKRFQLQHKKQDLEEDLADKFNRILKLKKALYNKFAHIQDIENEAGEYKARIKEYKKKYLEKLELANGRLLDAFSAIKIEILSVENKLAYALNGIHWYSIARKIDALALKRQLIHLKVAKKKIAKFSDILVAEIEFVDIHLGRMMVECTH